MKIYALSEIQSAINIEKNLASLFQSQRQAFVDFSLDKIVLPLPIQLKFDDPKGDCHIKAGFKKGDDFFVIKAATGFYQNSNKGLPAGDGVVLIFSQHTGLLYCILHDEGFLTTLRTALAALVASSLGVYKNIGIIGSGNLGQLVAKLMKQKYPDSSIAMWGRDPVKTAIIARNLGISRSRSIEKIVSEGGLVITTTASRVPIIYDYHIKQPVHIVAMGADEVGKQELDISVFALAGKIIVDSIDHAIKFGDSSYAIRDRVIDIKKLEELGKLLNSQDMINEQLVITDLTGLAAQDIAMARLVITNCFS